MQRRSEYHRRRLAASRSWSVFPRSVGIVAAAITLALTLSPIDATAVFLLTWFALAVIKAILPADIYDRNLWGCLGLIALPVGIWFVKWSVMAAAVAYSIWKGAPAADLLFLVLGLLALDFVILAGIDLLRTALVRPNSDEDPY